MDKAYVETTVLTDALLKCGAVREQAIASLARYKETELPVYAIKEFKAGPLKNYKWFHNKLVQTKSLTQTLQALHSISRTPHRYLTSTALEAAVRASESFAKHTPQSLAQKYGSTASMDQIEFDEYRLATKLVIMKGWAKRRSLTTHVVHPLACYKESAPYENRGLIELDPMKCEKEDCCMSSALKAGVDSLTKMRAVLMSATDKESIKRRQALGDIIRLPKFQITEKVCKDLGDAIFSFFCPSDAAILTTNVKHHQPLAQSINKQVEPSQTP